MVSLLIAFIDDISVFVKCQVSAPLQGWVGANKILFNCNSCCSWFTIFASFSAGSQMHNIHKIWQIWITMYVYGYLSITFGYIYLKTFFLALISQIKYKRKCQDVCKKFQPLLVHWSSARKFTNLKLWVFRL